MSYTPYYAGGWKDGSGGSTPIVAAGLNYMETGITNAAATADAAVPKPSPNVTNGVVYWNGSVYADALLLNAMVDPAAAITYSKLQLAGSVVNNDIATGAAIAYSKLNLASSIVSNDIVDGTILDADINASAAIKASKLANTLADGPPGTEIAYVEFATPTTLTAGTNTEAAPLDLISSGTIAFNGTTAVFIEVFFPRLSVGATSGAQTGLSLWDTTDQGRLGLWQNNAAAALIFGGLYMRRKVTPSNASHTFKVRGWAVTANGGVNPGAGGVGVEFPAFIRITKA